MTRKQQYQTVIDNLITARYTLTQMVLEHDDAEASAFWFEIGHILHGDGKGGLNLIDHRKSLED